ncbi:MAG: heme-binding protein [Verrucomicrobia bacterium]|nr:heme-binding protein [Verrucomicrobiota bacterium]
MHKRSLSRLLLVILSAFAAPSLQASRYNPASTPPSYDAGDLTRIAQQAADRACEQGLPRSVIAIVDRDGRELALLRANGEAPSGISATERAIAVSKAGTAVFLSSNEQAFTTRTAGFIIQPNFPPGVRNRPPGPLVGVGFSNLSYSDINRFTAAAGVAPIPNTRLYASPGGVPLYKKGLLFAGLGVTGDGTEAEDYSITRADPDENAALSGQLGYAPPKSILASEVLIDGVRLPYTDKAPRKPSPRRAPTPIIAPPPAPMAWPQLALGGVTGELRAPIIGDPVAGALNGSARLRADEVRAILNAAATRAQQTRAGIRLPLGRPAQVFISVVNNPGTPGQAPVVLGTFRTPDAPIFSWDVSVQKARTVLYYINARPGLVVSSRSVGFLAQENFPPGINGKPPGPLHGEQLAFSLPLLTGAALLEPELPNGITIFPGGFPLYRNGVLIGAIGVSGDGIDQDDLIAASGATGWEPPAEQRADYQFEQGVRLPYAKFPRDPLLRREAKPVTRSP